MATSAIGPGFITQTTVFTQQLLTSFGFVILISIILDIAAQLNIWRIIAVAELRAQDISNRLLPGMGYLLAVLIVIGGLAFNIGNIAGAGLGVDVIFGFDNDPQRPVIGAVISTVIALIIFWVKEAGLAMDWFARILGFVMIGLTLYVAISSQPPVLEAVHRTFIPVKTDITAIVTLVGGTVGGYISFAGAHRLLDAGIKGQQVLPQVTRSSVTAILLASVMRILLFLAALGVVMAGGNLLPDNPAASVFQIAAGNAGYRIFGVVLWCGSLVMQIAVAGRAYYDLNSTERQPVAWLYATSEPVIVVDSTHTMSVAVHACEGRSVVMAQGQEMATRLARVMSDRHVEAFAFVAREHGPDPDFPGFTMSRVQSTRFTRILHWTARAPTSPLTYIPKP